MIVADNNRPLQNLLLVLFAVFLSILLFRDLIIYRIAFIWNHIFRGGDIVQHVAPTWRYYFGHRGFDVGRDMISDYYLDVILPPLYKFFYWFLTIFVTPPESSSIIALAINLIILSAITISAYVVTKNVLVATAVSALTLNLITLSSIWSTGLERSIGSALLATSLLFIVLGRLRLLGLLALIAVLIYPPAALLIFCSYSVALLIQSGASLENAKKVVTLGVFFAVLALPQILAGKAYGDRLTRSDANRFEEVGSGGRLSSVDRGSVQLNPWTILKQNVGRYLVKISLNLGGDSSDSGSKVVSKKFKTYKNKLVNGVAILIVASCFVIGLFYRRLNLDRRHLLKQILILPVSMIGCYLAAILLFPWLYIPSRYISIGASVLMLGIVPMLLWFSLEVFKNKIFSSVAFILLLSGFIFLLHGGRPQVPVRLKAKKVALNKHERRNNLENAVAALPTTAMVAGWPSGAINSIPFVTGRQALITEETHQVFHSDYLYEMRRRMDALIDLLCVQTGDEFDRAARALKTEFKASHILVDLRYQHVVPRYFAPFGEAVAACRAHNPMSPQRFLLSFGEQRIIYQDKETALLEISG